MGRDPTKVVLTAGFSRSKHVYILAEMLRRSEVKVKGIIGVSPFTVSRIKRYVRRFGVRRVFNHHLPRLLGMNWSIQTKGEVSPLDSLAEERDIEPGSLRTWARRYNSEYVCVRSINADAAIEALERLQPDWVVYGGGGILRSAFINAVNGRILNAHSGPLPEVRGMNACEWSILLGHHPTVTVHMINRGIDTGGVISEHRVSVRPGDTIETLRERCVAVGIAKLKEAVCNPPKRIPEPIEEGESHRQCFVLSPALREILERYFERRRNYLTDASSRTDF